jgi:threonine synthase
MMASFYELRCRECGKRFPNQPLSSCDECFSSLEVAYDMAAAKKTFTREAIARGPQSMWRYQALLPLPDDYVPTTPTGMTPLMAAPRLAKRIGATNLYLKNDAVCLPTLSFKDRVVSVALARAKIFGFDTVGCSSTGNLANAVAAHAARLGLKTYILVPTDLEPAKILNTQVYGANLVRIDGNYDQVNRLSTQIAERYNWGFVNVNLRPYYAEGSKTVGYEIAEQLGWRLPDNVVVPMAGGALISKIHKAFGELVELGLVEDKPPLPTRSRMACHTTSRSGRTLLRARWRSAILLTGLMPSGPFVKAAAGRRMFPTWRSFPRSRSWPRRKVSLPKPRAE